MQYTSLICFFFCSRFLIFFFFSSRRRHTRYWRDWSSDVCSSDLHAELSVVSVYGGVPLEPQQKKLRAGVDIVVATPGRLIDHLERQNVVFDELEILVLDEADRMLDMGFAPRSEERRVGKERRSGG